MARPDKIDWETLSAELSSQSPVFPEVMRPEWYEPGAEIEPVYGPQQPIPMQQTERGRIEQASGVEQTPERRWAERGREPIPHGAPVVDPGPPDWPPLPFELGELTEYEHEPSEPPLPPAKGQPGEELQKRAYGFVKGSQFSDIPPHLRPDSGFYNPQYPSMLREAIELGIVSVEDGRKLYAEYDKFKNTPEGQTLGAKRQEDFAKGEQARFGMEVSEMEAGKLDQMASQWENYDQKARRLQAERRAYMEEFRGDYARQMDSYKMAMDDLRRTHMPRKSWSDKLMAGIAVALGALGSAVARTPNYPLQILMKNIDSEMAAFQTDLKRKRGLVFMEGNLLGEMRSRLKSEDAAYSATRQFLMQDTVNKIKAVQASSDSSIIRKKADAAIAAISAEIQVENKRIQAKLSGAAQQAAMIAAMGARRTAASKAQQEALGGFTPLDKLDQLIFGGAPVGDWALTEGSKVGSVGLRNLRKSVAGTKTELSVAQELISHLKRGFPTDPAGIYRMKQLSTMMLSAVIRERGANLTALEVKLLRAMSGGDPGSLTYNVFQKMQPAMLKGVQRFAKWRKDKTHDELKTAGFRQVQTKKVMTDKGVKTLKKEMPELWVVQPEVEFQGQ
jgi:hypothetical protein